MRLSAKEKQAHYLRSGMTLLAATLLSVTSVSSAKALDTLQGIRPPSLKPSLPSIQTPAVKSTGPGTPKPEARVISVGIVRKQGITSYMYGTHILVNTDGKTIYALKSDRINLDRYVGTKVTVSGELIKGYPVENGPNYLNVTDLHTGKPEQIAR